MKSKFIKAKLILNLILSRYLTAWQSFIVHKNNRLIPNKYIVHATIGSKRTFGTMN